MRMIDVLREEPVDILQLYLTESEARRMRDRLDELLQDPEFKFRTFLKSEPGLASREDEAPAEP